VDKDTRNAIERATQQARKLLEDDFASQLEGMFDVLRVGTVAAKAGPHLTTRQVFQREKIVAAIEHKRAAGMSAAEAVPDYLRDAAFTTINRFVALKMLEARELVQECITKGEQSSGYCEFCGLAPGVALLPDSSGYRLYIESLFDELSTEVKVLFDRRDPASVLWPKRATFEALLDVLNATDLSDVWGEDETVGWVYQFFNSGDERKRMREESLAPRNSRELAVRNQFFTPRYVVEFLVDNTLGRIWYEMRGTKTALAERCEYMVCKPGEEFAPRAKKDPRDLRVLDPACGSGHFLLYAFDLLVVVYEEAQADPGSPRSEATGRTLAEDYPSLDALRTAVPGLIVAHNLHGVDIDPRCAQIAQLALWLRTQRAWRDAGIQRANRPRVTRTNVVIAEPMPGNEGMVEEFATGLSPALLGDLFRTMVRRMALAGEMGSLLRADEVLKDAIDAARKEYRKWRGVGTVGVLPGLALPRQQGEVDLSGVNDESFFHDAEARIREALENYVAHASLAQSVRRRLFAEDAGQGLAFIELCEKRFDVVLMNPPFGEPTKIAKKAGGPDLGSCDDDLGAAFIHAAARKWALGGRIGVVSSSTIWFKHTLGDWRRAVLVSNASEGAGASAIALGAHLGGHVLDNASVGAAATVIAPSDATASALFFRCLRAEDKGAVLIAGVADQRQGIDRPPVFRVPIAELRAYRKSPLVYWISPALRADLTRYPALEGSGAEVRVGVQCSDDPRFVRAWWEIPLERVGNGKDWLPFAKSSEYSPFWDDITWIVRWKNDGSEVRAFGGSKPQNTQYYGRSGVTFPARAVLGFNPRAFPAGIGFGHMGSVAFPKDTTAPTLLGYLSSRPAEYVLSFSNGSLQGRKGAYQNHYEVGQVGDLPWPEFDGASAAEVGRLGDTISLAAMQLQRNDETTHQHHAARALHSSRNIDEYLAATMEEDRKLVKGVFAARARLDELVSSALGFRPDDVAAMNEEFAQCDLPTDGPWCPTQPGITSESHRETARSVASLAIGVAIGRFDVRSFLPDAPQAPEMFPLAAFRTAPPTVLDQRNLDGYPLKTAVTTMLEVDRFDPTPLNDRLRGVLALLWPNANPDGLTQLTEALQVGHLCEYLSATGSTGFLADHARRYSKGRRRAPLYWCLGTVSGAFGVLLLAPEATADTIFVLRNDVLAPRLVRAERTAEAIRREAGANPNASGRAAMNAADAFVSELRAFMSEVELHAPLWAPNVDDGLVVNAAPFYRLMPHRKSRTRAEATWKELRDGELDWSHLSMRFWPERVIPKCATDRSLAIAHGVEGIFWIEGADGKWKARTTPTKPVDELVRERSSSAVTAALKSLLDAPSPGGSTKRTRGGKTDA
jgi:Eco57I restriction-modification methylase